MLGFIKLAFGIIFGSVKQVNNAITLPYMFTFNVGVKCR